MTAGASIGAGVSMGAGVSIDGAGEASSCSANQRRQSWMKMATVCINEARKAISLDHPNELWMGQCLRTGRVPGWFT